MAVAIATGGGHSCALRVDGTAACWGDNLVGQLGDGTTITRLTPVNVQGITGLTALAAGQDHTCALRADGSMACWGANGHGQLGDNTTTSRSTPVPVSALSQVVGITGG
jgi:alpha-tubulin suppressor-like RCC1 family protein